MKNVMTKAWEIAKEAVAKFGGKVKEYFAEALKMAWAIEKAEVEVVKVPATIEIELSGGSRKHKSWVAEIVDRDAKYGLKREFINGYNKDNAMLYFQLENGKVYDINDASGLRRYKKVVNGELVEMGEYEVKEMFA